MKKCLFLLISLFCLNMALIAQDQLFRKDNTKLMVKIIEVGTEEIKYKLTANPDGPVYTESKSNVIMIVFENGQHEIINAAPAPAATSTIITTTSIIDIMDPPMSKTDSLKFYSRANNVSLNFLNFFNLEVGLIYQRDFFKKQFNLIVPMAVGLGQPKVTQSTYFNSNVVAASSGSGFILNRKLGEIGLGINYYPSLRKQVSYFIGPVFRYMRFEGAHYANFYDKVSLTRYTAIQNAKLNRYCISITNGFVARTRSRLTISMFASLGFKQDIASDPINDPVTGERQNTYNTDFSLYFWGGCNVGFSF